MEMVAIATRSCRRDNIMDHIDAETDAVATCCRRDRYQGDIITVSAGSDSSDCQ